MYFPYVRGKQFDLIALREMCEFVDNQDLISPIIEPVKLSFTSLTKCLSFLENKNINYTLIVNPSIGEAKNAHSNILAFVTEIEKRYENFQVGFLIDNTTDLDEIDFLIKDYVLNNIAFICDNIPNDFSKFKAMLEDHNIKFIATNRLIQSNRFNALIRKSKLDLVSLSDPFIPKDRNAEYAKIEDEFFSDEHLYFSDNGYIGFSDYLTIGKKFNEGGFLPFAVAIHMTYLDMEDEIRIKHFVSDSNGDYEDVPGKFGEANRKLAEWLSENNIETKAAKIFLNLNNEGNYPGLGSIKKLSMIHHIEVIYKFLNSI